MTFGSLFAGIGGIDLGLERAGMECRWQVEIDSFCRKVLAKHWPNVRRYEDVREVGAANLEPVDLVAGGFPCQDVSNAGKREGLGGERSGLWREFYRVIRELQPRLVLVENTTGLSVRGLGAVLGDLASAGFDAEWATIPASAFGAAHRRERVFVLAHPTGEGLDGWITSTGECEVPTQALDNVRNWPALSSPLGLRKRDGVPDFVDRITALGNAVVPQVAEWIGRRILEHRL